MDDVAGRRFLTNRVMTATPAQRIVMMYDRALLDLARAQQKFDAADPVAASEQLMHALAIVSELRAVLDVSRWDGAAQLGSLYDWTMSELIASRAGDPKRLEKIVEILQTLRAAWEQAGEQMSGRPPVALGSAV